MRMMYSIRCSRLWLCLIVMLSLAACQASATATPTAEPTEIPSATATRRPSATPPPTDTPEPTEIPPTETLVLTDTPEPPSATPFPPLATTKIIVNVRAGPGAAYPLIGKLQRGQSRPILGKSQDNQWWQVQYEDKLGWIAADLTDVRGGINGVPVITVAQLPSSTPVSTRSAALRPPTNTPTADIPSAGGRIYFVVKQPDMTYSAAWVRPAERENIFADVVLGDAPGDFSEALSTNATPLDWSEATGKLAYVVGGAGQNRLQTVDREQTVVDIASHGTIVTPRWTSNGEQLYYIGYDNNFQNQKIYVVNADGTNRLGCFGARSGEMLRGLDVSPTTREIVFVSNLSGSYELWKMGPDCANPVQLTDDRVDTTAPAFSPDGRTITFVSNKAGPTAFDIYLMNSDGTNVRRMVDGFSPVFSPDGNWIAYSRNGEVYIMDITGNNIQTIVPGYRPAWAP